MRLFLTSFTRHEPRAAVVTCVSCHISYNWQVLLLFVIEGMVLRDAEDRLSIGHAIAEIDASQNRLGASPLILIFLPSMIFCVSPASRGIVRSLLRLRHSATA